MVKLIYPSAERIVEYNLLVLALVKVKKADKGQVLDMAGIRRIVSECEEKEGDLYDKAVVLVKGLVKKHPFASGNRRTAFIVTKEFIAINKGTWGIKDEPSSATIMRGIREGYYSDEEIKEWINYGKIREFRRYH
ncbi:MAG: Fic family protein [Candidatus Woesearchaeota archaeon]|nr:Fic family protein [Candidatus Woesearchaeota archaeon]